MRNLPVHWREGLFLRPHHFQAADRHWSELIQTSQRWDRPYGYGLQAFEFSPEALANGHLEVRTVRARMRDGTLIDLESGQEPDRVSLKDGTAEPARPRADLGRSFETESVVRVYLAVPKLKLGLKNVAASESGDGAAARFSGVRSALQDEDLGGNDQEVELRRLNVEIRLSTQDLSGYEVLPIAQVRRAGDSQAVPRLDADYIPPVLAIEAWPGLGRDMVRAVYDVIGQKAEVLAQQIVNRDVGLDSRHPGDLDRVLMLTQLNEARATLGVLAFASGVHPLTAYTELCRIAGRLAVFGPARLSADLPAYDHEDLARIFRAVRERIETLINVVRNYEFEQRFFVGVGLGLQVSLEPRWFNSDWEWFVGVKKGDLTRQECSELLSSGMLDWKLGSNRQVEILFQRRAEGLRLTLLDRPVRALPAGQDWLYYEVSRDSPAWRDVQETQTLAMRLRDSLILNQDRLQGERQLVVSARGRRVALEFALFAVPTPR
jgi:type VI secretion system protein ImpJ